jgi:predicted phage baseplate assembly protein
MRIEIDAPDPADLFDTAPPSAGGRTTEWTEVPSLAVRKPYERVFELDGANGIVTFGDGVHGAVVPAGFRQVRATSYRTGGGAVTNVDADAGFAPRGTIPFLTGIENPTAAAGGRDVEPTDALVTRGPALLGTRGRAITAADVEVLAPDADAGIGRVIALPGVDSEGASRPGRLTLVVIGNGASPGPPPVPTAAVLDAVTAYFTTPRAPRIALGARVAVEPARFVPVQLEIAVYVDPDVDQAATLLAVARAADAYLDPRSGGDDRRGWQLGAPIRYRRLLAAIAAVAGVNSVRRIGVQVGGRSSRPCTDAALPPYTLPWPQPHLVIAVEEGDTR